MYNVRYRALKAARTIRNVAACVAFLAGSYLASGLINASPVMQPDLRTRRTGAVMVAPVVSPEPAETPMARPELPFAAPVDATQTL
jgi:hypothetical protein